MFMIYQKNKRPHGFTTRSDLSEIFQSSLLQFFREYADCQAQRSSTLFSVFSGNIRTAKPNVHLRFLQYLPNAVTAKAVLEAQFGNRDAAFVVTADISVPSVEFGACSGLPAPLCPSDCSRNIDRFSFDVFSYLFDQFFRKYILRVYVAYGFYHLS